MANWTYKPQPQAPHEQLTIENLAQSLSVTPTLAKLLWQRNIKNYEDAKYFFRPSIQDLHSPFLMKDMDKAVERLSKAIENQEIVMIYGDYDVDGTTSVALVYGFLSKYIQNIHAYNPDRYLEGYGVSKKGIDTAAELGVRLIISLDCGIKSADKISYAKNTFDIDFIVCDHHEPDENIPMAAAVLDPKQQDCPYPDKNLSGCGVGFKLLSGYCEAQNIPFEDLMAYIDLVMVSIASDLVPIEGENRILAFYGLQKINQNPLVGLEALIRVAGFSGQLTIENVVFVIGPRINAAGRIFHAKAAVDLLLEQDLEQALGLAYEIQNHNTQRRELDASITQQALAMIESDDWLKNQASSTVLYDPDWSKGVIGIVASRCIEKHYRPTIIFTKTSEITAAGSARSIPGFDLYTALEQCQQHLIQFGGHTHAAGMTIYIKDIPTFRMAFDTIAKQKLLPQQFIPEIIIDTEVSLDELTPKFYRIMRQMAPFGPENMQPIFVARNLGLLNDPRILKEKHLKLDVVDTQTGIVFPAIGFGIAESLGKNLSKNSIFDMAFSLEENTFRDKTTLQLFIRDIFINLQNDTSNRKSN